MDPIRSPRGTTLTARGWPQEAAMRMLQNNLDPDVAERPQDLVVYGGTGKAARDWPSYHALIRTMTTLADDETMLVQSGRPVGVFRTHEWAPRVLIANSHLVPDWATWPEFRRLEKLGLTMYGQMTAGSWIYIGTQGILQGTYETFAAVAAKRFGGTLAGTLTLTAGCGGMGGAQPLAVTMNGGVCLIIDVDAHRLARRVETRYLDTVADSLDDAIDMALAAKRERRALSIGVVGNAAVVVPDMLQRGVPVDIVTDQTSAHDPLSYVPTGIELDDATGRPSEAWCSSSARCSRSVRSRSPSGGPAPAGRAGSRGGGATPARTRPRRAGRRPTGRGGTGRRPGRRRMASDSCAAVHPQNQVRAAARARPGSDGRLSAAEQHPPLVGRGRLGDAAPAGDDRRDALAGQGPLDRRALAVGSDQHRHVAGVERPIGSLGVAVDDAGVERGARPPGRPGRRSMSVLDRADRDGAGRQALESRDRSTRPHRRAERCRAPSAPTQPAPRHGPGRPSTAVERDAVVAEHQPVAQAVHGLDDRPVGPPVGAQRAGGGASGSSAAREVGVHVAAAEAVDRLLRVTDDHERRRRAAPNTDEKICHCTGSVSWNSSISATSNRSAIRRRSAGSRHDGVAHAGEQARRRWCCRRRRVVDGSRRWRARTRSASRSSAGSPGRGAPPRCPGC